MTAAPRRGFALLVTLVAVGAATARAQAVASAPLLRGALSFDARATLGAFTGVTTKMTGQLRGATTLDSVRGWVEAPAQSLSTSNNHRDRDMAKSLEVSRFPILRFDLDQVVVGQSHGDSVAVTLVGRFSIHGQTRADSIPGWAWLRAAQSRFRGTTAFSVKDYGVRGLSKMLGMLSMNERITVHIDVTFGS